MSAPHDERGPLHRSRALVEVPTADSTSVRPHYPSARVRGLAPWQPWPAAEQLLDQVAAELEAGLEAELDLSVLAATRRQEHHDRAGVLAELDRAGRP